MEEKKQRRLKIQRAASKRYYQKKKRAKQGTSVVDDCRLLSTSSFRHSDANNRVLGIVDHWVNKIQKIPDIYQWYRFCQFGVTRVVISSYGLADEAENRTKLKDKVRTQSLVISPSNEIERQLMLQVRDPHKNEWSDIFIIKQSTIKGADYGLFAARPYSVNDVLGLYLGEVYPKQERNPKSEYALEIEWKGHQLIVDARNGPCGSYTECLNVSFRYTFRE